MNAKKAKAIRQVMRAKGMDPKQRVEQTGRAPVFGEVYENAGNGMKRSLGMQKQYKGKPTILLGCGRDTYRCAKARIKAEG